MHSTLNTMPKRPDGQKRPAGVTGNAVKIMKIATSAKGDQGEAAGGPQPGLGVSPASPMTDGAACGRGLERDGDNRG